MHDAAACMLKKNNVDQPQIVAGLQKPQGAFTENRINVFFSFKSKDWETAQTIVELLRKWSAEKIKIFYQGDFGRELTGEAWRNAIYEEIKKANWFILLLPDPKDDYDWCLFETGLFEAQRTCADRLICLHHHELKPPDPIIEYQAVSAEPSAVRSMLEMMFIEENPIPGMRPLNKSLADDIPEYADMIINAIRSPEKLIKEFYEPWIELQIIQPAELETVEQLDEALVVSINTEALALFGLTIKKKTWGELRRSVIGGTNKDGDQWLVDLMRLIRSIGKGEIADPIQAVFQAKNGKIYKPGVLAVDRADVGGPIKSFHLSFHEDTSTLDRSAMPHELSFLGNLLRTTFRFRWEVLEKFSTRPLTEEDLARLDTAISRIEQDWESRNVGEEKDIFDLFTDEKSSERVIEIIKKWRKIRNDFKTGLLDIAMEEKDVASAQKIMIDFLPENQAFLQMVSERFSNFIAES